MSQNITLTFPDGKAREFATGITGREVLDALNVMKLKKEAVAAKLDGEIIDFHTPLQKSGQISFFFADSADGLEVIRHSTSHMMADAVLRLFPGTKVTIGPAIENGFYYDFDRKEPFSINDLEAIEKEMAEVAKRGLSFTREEISKEEARKRFAQEPYKLELIDVIQGDSVSLYHHGGFQDLCRGPHVPSTSFLKAFKLLSVAGAYWRGNEKNPMLQRIYGTAFQNDKALKDHLASLEEAKKRDHRKLGKELGLFLMHPWAPGSPYFLPAGTQVYAQLIDYIRHLYRRYGYDEVISPQIFDAELFKTSGHYKHFHGDMFWVAHEEREFGVKSMNCPGHCLLYREGLHSYRALPIRYADFGRLHRAEASGTLHGITRVRSFCQDDAHIYCTPSQMEGEISSFIDMLYEVYRAFGFEQIEIRLATRNPEKWQGTLENWSLAESALQAALDKKGLPYIQAPGEAAFYGPKLEFHIKDALKRSWQLGTIQVDYSMPEQFDLSFVGEDNQKHRPVMLHRAVLGSLERFFGVLVEHCAGAFPVWLAPEQARVISISEASIAYGKKVLVALQAKGLRVKADFSPEHIKTKISNAQKVPYTLLVGDKDAADGTVSPRLPSREQLKPMLLEEFIERLVKEASFPS
jgi:threonyl-tRNA synthetase